MPTAVLGNLTLLTELVITTTGTLNDLSVTGFSKIIFNGATAQTVSGFAAFNDKVLFVENRGANLLTIKNDSSLSLSANRIKTGIFNDIILNQHQVCWIMYVTTEQCWKCMSFPNQVILQSDFTESNNTSQAYLKNKPTMLSQFSNDLNAAAIVSSLTYTPYDATNPSGFISSVPAQSFASLTSKPTTLTGFGITDGYSNTNPAGYISSVPAQSFSSITSKPTTIGGYGITDAYSNTNPSGYISSVPAQSFASITSKPSTLLGYGISDAYPLSGNPSGFLTSVAAQSWASITGKPNFGLVATSNNYLDLTGLPTIPTNTNQLTNGSGFITGITSGNVTTALGFTPYNSTNPNGYTNNVGTVTSIGLTSTDITIGGSSPITGSGSYSLTLPNIATAGTYDTVVVNAKGQITSGRNKTQSSPARSLNTAYKPSATQDCTVHLSVSISITSILAGTNIGTIQAQISSDGTTYTTVAQAFNSIGGVISTNNQGCGISFFVPANYFVKILTSQSGVNTPTFQILNNQEVLY
jgi:hypothetical protein